MENCFLNLNLCYTQLLGPVLSTAQAAGSMPVFGRLRVSTKTSERWQSRAILAVYVEAS